MLKSLVYLNEDLASSIALRYACRLSEMNCMKIDMLHVESPDGEGHLPAGTGWVRRTWENSMIQESREKILQLAAMERPAYPILGEPTIVMGNPETEIIAAIKENQYDLFIAGHLHTFSPRLFYKQMHSKLYQQACCPILLVKNLVDIKKVALLMEPGETGSPQASTFMKIFKGVSVDIDLLSCDFAITDPLGSHKNGVNSLDMETGPMDQNTQKVHGELNAGGITPQSSRRLEGTPADIGELLAAYHLVFTSLPDNIGPTSPLLDCLSHVPSALLFCRDY